MPIIQHVLTKLDKSKCFANLDQSHGYWKFTLHPSSQASKYFITPNLIYTPKRVMHGTKNAVKKLQSTLAGILPDTLQNSVLYWLADILLDSQSRDSLMDAIRYFFSTCKDYNIKLHPSKCTLFSKKIKWCGKIVSSTVIRYDPR